MGGFGNCSDGAKLSIGGRLVIGGHPKKTRESFWPKPIYEPLMRASVLNYNLIPYADISGVMRREVVHILGI